MINRRVFLRYIGIGIPALFIVNGQRTVKAGPLRDCDNIPVAPEGIPSGQTGFNPSYQYGRAMVIEGDNEELVIRRLHEDAKKVLPCGIQYELRKMVESSHPEWSPIMSTSACWYYSPRSCFPDVSEMNTKTWKYFPDYRTYIMGRFYA